VKKTPLELFRFIFVIRLTKFFNFRREQLGEYYYTKCMVFVLTFRKEIGEKFIGLLYRRRFDKAACHTFDLSVVTIDIK